MASRKTALGPELLLGLDRGDRRPKSTQLQDGLRAAIRQDRLLPGARLPSTRTFAVDLGVSRGVVVEAYAQLTAEGYLTARSGSPTRVAARARASEPQPPAREQPRSRLSVDFLPGQPDLALFPRVEWGRAMRKVLARAPDHALGYPDPRGVLRLREELAAYLGRVRGVSTDAERVVICSGFAQGLGLVSRVLASRELPLGVEDPGSPPAWRAIGTTAIARVPVPVDRRGLSVDALAAGRARSVLVTPAHQFPTGVALAPERRAALLGWASDGRIIIEDDYDAEFRYDRQPVGALQGLVPDRIIYAGSASKTLAPGLRLGWLVLPAHLVDDVIAAKRDADLGSPVLEQLALAELLHSGAYDRHLRRARRAYRTKRDELLGNLERHAPELSVTGLAAGLHTLLELPPGMTETELVSAARERSIGVYPLTRYRLASSGPPAAITLGYGGLTQGAIREGIARLASALADAG